jgi:hypothetical protein
MPGQSADHQSNREPYPFFVHAATLNEKWKNYNSDNLLAGFNGRENPSKDATGLCGRFRARFLPDPDKIIFHGARGKF